MTTPYEEGNPDSKIIALAEAPSYAEIREGRPLVGPSGEVFNNCLHTAGLRRGECYILNVWPFQVDKVKRGQSELFYPRNSAKGPNDLLWQTGKGFTEFGLEEAGSTLERIQRSGANVILTMGQQALDLATGKSKAIMRWRGSPIQGLPRVGGKSVIPTVHPAATLRGTYTWRYLIIADMEKVKRHKEFKTLQVPQRNLIINPSIKDIYAYMQRARDVGRVATDIEVINHQVSCFCICYDPKEAMCIPVGDEYGNSLWDEETEELIWFTYAAMMSDPRIMKINQNLVGFDAPFLLNQNNIFTRGDLGDPMIAQHICYPDFPKGLDFIASIHTDEPYYKDEGKMWKGMGGDIEQFWRYNAKDGCVALEAWDKLQAEMTEGGYWPTYEMTVGLAPVLTYMTVRGFKADLERLEKTKKRVEREIAEREDELRAVSEWPFSYSSPKQCAKYFYETKGLPAYKNKTGGVTTDDKALARIYRKTNMREAKLVQELRGLAKLKGTYLDIAFDKDSRLRCNWNPRGTWTGRLSSSATVFGTGTNMQNLHPEFREFLVAD